MADSPSTLQYEPNAPRQRGLSLEERDGTCRLTFPTPAAWIGWVNVSFALAGAAGQLAAVWMVIRYLMWISATNKTLPAGAQPIPVWSSGAIGAILMYFLYAFVLTGAAVWHYYTLRRERRIRKYLEIGPGELVYQRPTLFRRYRRWPVADVLGVEFKAVRSVLPRHRVARLVIRVRPGGKLPFQFSGPERIALAEQFAARVTEIATLSKPLPLGSNLG